MFEYNYCDLIKKILTEGVERNGRNGMTKSLFGTQLKIETLRHGRFPILTGRKMFIKGIVGEMAAFLEGPRDVHDFKKYNCNYWDDFAGPEGQLNIDYGNKWLNFNGINQIEKCIESLSNDPYGRRHIISGWDPSSEDLTLPCCHYAYQFYVENNTLSMIWIQRSVDTMIGLPSDMVLAALMLVLMANKVGLDYGDITMQLGDTHIYAPHFEAAHEYLRAEKFAPPVFGLHFDSNIKNFDPDHLSLVDYISGPKIDFELIT